MSMIPRPWGAGVWLAALFLVIAATLPLAHAADPQSVERLRVAAERGDAEAQFELGHRYEIGQGVG